MKKSLVFLVSLVFLSSITNAQYDPSEKIPDEVARKIREVQEEQEKIFDSYRNTREGVEPVEENEISSLGRTSFYTPTFKVYNISKNNADATISGANLGDILLYDLELKGKMSGEISSPSINISKMLSSVKIEDMNNGVLEGGKVLYPEIKESVNNWSRKYGLYIKVNNNKQKQETLTASFDRENLIVPLLDLEEKGCTSKNCDLTSSGPAKNIILLGIIIGLMSLITFVVVRR